MNTMIHHHRDIGSFNFRIGAVILKEDKILLCKTEVDDYYFFPGGRVDFFESSKKTLLREMKEELNEKAKIVRLLWTIEDLYTFRGKKTHEISMYYLVEFLDKDSKIYDLDKTITAFEGNVKIFFQWFDMKKLSDMKIRPKFLVEKIQNIPLKTEHIITPELEHQKLWLEY
ncbi:MAG: NUDIX domain-containing protein [Parachlamydiales bacterium]|nr:NUDIX domain-containing protein [Parachlamydiales bacterium]